MSYVSSVDILLFGHWTFAGGEWKNVCQWSKFCYLCDRFSKGDKKQGWNFKYIIAHLLKKYIFTHFIHIICQCLYRFGRTSVLYIILFLLISFFYVVLSFLEEVGRITIDRHSIKFMHWMVWHSGQWNGCKPWRSGFISQ